MLKIRISKPCSLILKDGTDAADPMDAAFFVVFAAF